MAPQFTLMTGKPTYEELEQRVKELELEVIEKRQIEKALEEEKYYLNQAQEIGNTPALRSLAVIVLEHTSKPLRKLVKVHRERKLTPEKLLRISNWVDTNAQYYGSYYGRRNLKDKGHPNFRPVPDWGSAVGIPPLPDDKR